MPITKAIDVSDEELDAVCAIYRHDYQMMRESKKVELRKEARRWLEAFYLKLIDSSPDKITIYQHIKTSGARKHADIAEVIADTLPLAYLREDDSHDA